MNSVTNDTGIHKNNFKVSWHVRYRPENRLSWQIKDSTYQGRAPFHLLPTYFREGRGQGSTYGPSRLYIKPQFEPNYMLLLKIQSSGSWLV